MRPGHPGLVVLDVLDTLADIAGLYFLSTRAANAWFKHPDTIQDTLETGKWMRMPSAARRAPTLAWSAPPSMSASNIRARAGMSWASARGLSSASSR